MIIPVYVDGATLARMRIISSELSRKIEDLADSAVSEAALTYFRGRRDDPGDSATEILPQEPAP